VVELIAPAEGDDFGNDAFEVRGVRSSALPAFHDVLDHPTLGTVPFDVDDGHGKGVGAAPARVHGSQIPHAITGGSS
jgi:hypothetical protein